MKEKALCKMLQEMEGIHTRLEDAIHNWLCDQDDDLLFSGIMDSQKSIRGAANYCTAEAKKKAKGASCVPIDAETLYSWIYLYFTAVSPKKPLVTPPKKKAAPKPQKKSSGKEDKAIQMDIFNFL